MNRKNRLTLSLLDRGEALGDSHCPVALPLLIHIHEAALPDAELRLAAAEQPAERRDGGGSVVGRYGLLVPYKNRAGDDGFFGKLVKVDLEAFVVEAVLDLTRLEINSKTTEISGDALRGFVGGVSFGKYFC